MDLRAIAVCLALSGCGFWQTLVCVPDYPGASSGPCLPRIGARAVLENGAYRCINNRYQYRALTGLCELIEQPAPAQPQSGCLLPDEVVDNIDYIAPDEAYKARPCVPVKPLALPCAPHCSFTIKTRTEDHGLAEDVRTNGLGGEPHCKDPADTMEYGDTCEHNPCTLMYRAPRCVRVTHELYLSGQLLGTLEER